MKLNIDWTKVDSRFKYAVMDSSGKVYLYVHLPSPLEAMWDSDRNYASLVDHAARVGGPNWKDILTERPQKETEMRAQNNTHPHAAIIADAIKDTSRKIECRQKAHGSWAEISLNVVVNASEDWEFRFADTAPTVISPLTDDELLAVWYQTGPATNHAERRMRDLKRVAIAVKVATIRKVADISFNMPFAAATVAEFRVQMLKLIGE